MSKKQAAEQPAEGLVFDKNKKQMAVIAGEIVPGRDLTAEEVERYGRAALLASGLYTEIKTRDSRQSDGTTDTEK